MRLHHTRENVIDPAAFLALLVTIIQRFCLLVDAVKCCVWACVLFEIMGFYDSINDFWSNIE